MARLEPVQALLDYYGLKTEGRVGGDNEAELFLTTPAKLRITGVMPIVSHLNTKRRILGTSQHQR